MIESEFTIADDFAAGSYEQWRALVDQDLKGAAFEKKLVSRTYDGIEIQPLYTQRDWPKEGVETPVCPAGGPAGSWSIRQLHTAADLRSLREAIADDFKHGVQSVEVRLDDAARAGLDPDDEAAAELVGRGGAMMYTLADFRELLAETGDESRVVEFDGGAAFAVVAAMRAALAHERGIRPFDSLRAPCKVDPLGALARDGALPHPIGAALQSASGFVRYALTAGAGCGLLTVETSPYHAAGASAAQDLAVAGATAIEYLRSLERAGVAADHAVGQMTFRFSIGCNLFGAIAKLRAIKRMWARVVQACGASPGDVAIHARTSDRVITARDPWVNLLRNTICCFAGAVAGAETITTVPFDARLGPSDAFSRRVARNTQLLLREEAHLAKVADPARGSWFIESLTDQMAAQGWEILQAIERRGGMAEALTSGWIAGQIDAVHQLRREDVATRKDPITGVSEFPNVQKEPIVRPQRDRVAQVAAARARFAQREKSPELPAALQRIAASSDDGRMEALIDAAAAGGSIGQMMRALAKGASPVKIRPLPERPLAQPYEELRDVCDGRLAALGRRPRVFLANMGPIAHHTARATYSKNFFEAGGFEVLGAGGFDDADTAAAAFRNSGAKVAVICSSDRLYETYVPHVAPKLKQAGARTVILAGHPGDREGAYRAAGVDRFIYIRCNVLETLRELLGEEGVLS